MTAATAMAMAQAISRRQSRQLFLGLPLSSAPCFLGDMTSLDICQILYIIKYDYVMIMDVQHQ